MTQFYKGLIFLSFFGTTTSKILLSPIASVLGLIALAFRLSRLRNYRTLLKVEWALIAFMGYFFISTFVYHPHAFFEYGYYRYDGNLFVSYMPIFAVAFITPIITLQLIRKFILLTFVVYGGLFIYWYVTKECNIGGWCSFGGLYEARNATGGFLSVVAMITFVIWLQVKEKMYGLIFFGFVIILFFTLSRGSLIALIASTSIYLVYIKRGWRLDIAVIAVLAFASLFVAYQHYRPSYDYKHIQISTDDFIKNGDIKSANVLMRSEYLWPKSIELNPLNKHGILAVSLDLVK